MPLKFQLQDGTGQPISDADAQSLVSPSCKIAIILVEQHTEIALSLTEEAVVIERGRIVHRARSRDLPHDSETLERLVGLRVSA